MTGETLVEEVQERVRDLGTIDVVVAVPTFNNQGTVEQIVKSIREGLSRSFPQARPLLLNCDGGSTDDTSKLFQEAAGSDVPHLTVAHPVPSVRPRFTAEHGIPGYENAYRVAFETVRAAHSQACAVIDGNLKSVSPEWMTLLLSPIVERQFDLVAPLFRRHKFDGSLTNSVVYPLNRALYGKRLRFQTGGGHGFSGKLVAGYLEKPGWGGQLAHDGLDNWLATIAAADGYDVCHACLGAKVQDSRASGAELAVMLAHAVGAVFGLMEETVAIWESRRGSSAVPVFGPPVDVTTGPVAVNVQRMVKAFRQGLRDLLPLWELILSVDTLGQVLPLGLVDVEEFRFPPDVWVHVVYDFALGYHDKVVHREHLLKALTPLYLGRTASFIMEARDSGAEEVERLIERLCLEYESRKSYLVERWR